MLFKAHQHLVVAAVAKCAATPQSRQALAEAGNQGLTKAIRTFTIAGSQEFLAYATDCIQSAVKAFQADANPLPESGSS